MSGKIEIFKSENSGTEVEVRFENETVWLNQYQIAELFQTDRTSVLKHLQNIYAEAELDEKATCAKFSQVRTEGKRQVKREILHYNLDAVISVGYRTSTAQATRFRQWATARLKDYLVKGYALNTKRLAQKEEELHHLKTAVRILSRAAGAQSAGQDFLGLFSKGLSLLDDYDHETLDRKGKTEQAAVYPSEEAYEKLIEEMKAAFDSEVFGREKDGGFRSALAQIGKGFGDTDFYPSIEEKAAVLLYLIVKNHAFADGNKRIAAACFLLFLEKNDLLFKESGEPLFSNEALAALTLFVAVGKSEEMETVKSLIVSVLNRNQ